MCGQVLYTIVLYVSKYERHTCWWSDKSVLLEVNSQEDGSVCFVLRYTSMIYLVSPSPHSFYFHLYHLISLSASTLKQMYYVLKKSKRGNTQRARGNKPFTPTCRKQQNANGVRCCRAIPPQKDSGITHLHLHMCWYVCTQAAVHAQEESHTQKRNSQ